MLGRWIPRFNLRAAFVGLAFVGLACAAVLQANAWWLAFSWTLALFALATSIVLIVYRRGEQRAFWVGFALFGGGYLALASGRLDSQYEVWSPITTFSQVPLSQRLLTTAINQWLYQRLTRSQTVSPPALMPGAYTVSSSSGGMVTFASTLPQVQPLPPSNGAAETQDENATVNGYTSPTGGAVAIPSPAISAPPAVIPGPVVPTPEPGHFGGTAHAYWSLLAALLGAIVAQGVFRTRPEERNEFRSTPATP